MQQNPGVGPTPCGFESPLSFARAEAELYDHVHHFIVNHNGGETPLHSTKSWPSSGSGNGLDANRRQSNTITRYFCGSPIKTYMIYRNHTRGVTGRGCQFRDY